MSTESPALCLDRVRRTYGTVVAVDDVTFAVQKGQFLTLLGPSGSGKTSTLRIIGGFEKIERGAVHIGGQRIDHLPPYRRDTATVFQSGALFPHKTVAENIAYGLRMRGAAKAEIADRVTETLDIVRLSGFEGRYPSQLSGGQKQRVAIARALALRPAILLFDEPLSALDLSLRLQLRAEIKRLHDELGFTAVYVTHDQGEAMAMSSQVAVMNHGHIEQLDTPARIFHEPASEFVYTFIGESCCMPVQFSSGAAADEAGEIIDLQMRQRPGDGAWRLYVRPSRLRLGDASKACDNRLNARIRFVEFLGEVYRYHLGAGAVELFCDCPAATGHNAGDLVPVGWDSRDTRFYA
jgi:ABC-type Fe3+/spermidine/putrescine transport system ATPase subunit